MLYVVATPIGNLSDITFRAIETLKSCDYILCEDTRHSLLLLKHYAITKPLKSFHKFSESSKEKEVLDDLLQGLSIALISDAGTPGISDPGTKLIQACFDQGIKVIPIPGPCAAITALCASGLNTERFQFFGFLPRKPAELKRTLLEIISSSLTTICYESPNRLLHTLECLHEISPERLLTVSRELTKKFEETKRGNALTLLNHWKNAPLKGECVLLISGESTRSKEEWETLTFQQHVEIFESNYGLTRQESIAAVAKIRGISKRDVYNTIHRNK